MKARTEQVEIEYNLEGVPVYAQMILTIHESAIFLVRLHFERTYEGVTFEFEVKDGEHALRHFTDREAIPNQTYVICQYEGKVKE